MILSLTDEQIKILKAEILMAIKKQYALNQINKNCISDFDIKKLNILEQIRKELNK